MRPVIRALLVSVLGLATALSPVSSAQAENSPPVLSEFSLSPSSLGYEGGEVAISVDVEDEDGIGAVSATVHMANGEVLDAPMEVSAHAENAPTTYSGTVDIPANFTDEPVVHSVEIAATDSLGASAVELMGWIDVDSQPQFDEPPAVSEPSITPSELPSGGGSVMIEATVTDNRSVSEVNAVITDPAGGETPLQLDPISSTRFVGYWAAPENLASDPQVYGVKITAHDDAGLSAQIDGGQFTVLGVEYPGGQDNPPIINSVTVVPTDLPAEGGSATITVDAIDDYGIFMAYADVAASGDSVESVQLLPSSSSTYSGTVNLAPNQSAEDVVYGVSITVTDTAGATDSAPGDAITVAGTPASALSKLTLSKRKVDFGRVQGGGRVTQKIILTNTGVATSVSGVIPVPGGRFRVAGSRGEPVAFTLDPGEVLRIGVVYRTTSTPGADQGVLEG